MGCLMVNDKWLEVAWKADSSAGKGANMCVLMYVCHMVSMSILCVSFHDMCLSELCLIPKLGSGRFHHIIRVVCDSGCAIMPFFCMMLVLCISIVVVWVFLDPGD